MSAERWYILEVVDEAGAPGHSRVIQAADWYAARVAAVRESRHVPPSFYTWPADPLSREVRCVEVPDYDKDRRSKR